MTRPILPTVLACFLSAAAAQPLLAQGVLQPPSNATAAAASLTDAQRAEIESFLKAHTPNLSSQDDAQVRAARAAILDPLRAPAVSVSFRIEYARTLSPVLASLVASPRDVVAVNALRLAGELAVPASFKLLETPLADARPAVRYAAYFGYARFFEALASRSPAVTPEQLSSALAPLAAAVAKESDATVLDGACLALSAACRVPDAQVKGLRSRGVELLSTTMGDHALNAKDAHRVVSLLGVLIRAGQTVRDALTDISQPPLAPETQKSAARFAGDAAAAASRACETREELVRLSQLANLAEAIAFFGANALGAPQQKFDLAKAIEGDCASYHAAAARLVAMLTSPPFAFAKDRFTLAK